LEGEKEMSVDFYLQIMSCVLLTAVTVVVVACAIWYANFVYTDFVEKREWRKRNETL
jgi:succinate dehydrogenase hydrophobic anchor subunit